MPRHCAGAWLGVTAQSTTARRLRALWRQPPLPSPPCIALASHLLSWQSWGGGENLMKRGTRARVRGSLGMRVNVWLASSFLLRLAGRLS